MSALIHDKSLPVRRRLRWPFSTAFTLSVLSLSLLLLLWWGVTALGLIAPLFLPSPQQVFSKLLVIASAQGFMDATLWQHLAASLNAMLIALTAAASIGFPVGILMGLIPVVRGLPDPPLDIQRPIPPPA